MDQAAEVNVAIFCKFLSSSLAGVKDYLQINFCLCLREKEILTTEKDFPKCSYIDLFHCACLHHHCTHHTQQSRH